MSAYYASAFGGHGTGSRSRRAQLAEAAGREPATRAAKTWGFRSAKALREWVKTNEWHHVGKYASAVDYYDVRSWIEDMGGASITDLVGLSSALTRRGKEIVLAEIVHRIVRSNLDCSPAFADNGSRGRLAKHLGVECGAPILDEIVEKRLSVCDAGARIRADRIEQKRAAVRAKIQANLAWRPPASRRGGIEAIKASLRRHGVTWNINRYARLVRDGMPFGQAIEEQRAEYRRQHQSMEAAK